MAARKVGDKWFVIKKDGSLGKRGFATQKNALAAQSRGRSFKGGKKSAGRRVAQRAPAAARSSSPKKMTVSKVNDLYALGGAGVFDAANYMGHGDQSKFIDDVVSSYTGFRPSDGQLDLPMLVRGYGGGINRVIEKKALKALGIRGPPSKIKTAGHALDLISYYGKTARDIYIHRDNPALAAAAASKNLNGIDPRYPGWASYQPKDKLVNSVGPYIVQKMVRKGLKRFGVNFGGLI